MRITSSFESRRTGTGACSQSASLLPRLARLRRRATREPPAGPDRACGGTPTVVIGARPHARVRGSNARRGTALLSAADGRSRRTTRSSLVRGDVGAHRVARAKRAGGLTPRELLASDSAPRLDGAASRRRSIGRGRSGRPSARSIHRAREDLGGDGRRARSRAAGRHPRPPTPDTRPRPCVCRCSGVVRWRLGCTSAPHAAFQMYRNP